MLMATLKKKSPDPRGFWIPHLAINGAASLTAQILCRDSSNKMHRKSGAWDKEEASTSWHYENHTQESSFSGPLGSALQEELAVVHMGTCLLNSDIHLMTTGFLLAAHRRRMPWKMCLHMDVMFKDHLHFKCAR